MPRTGIDFLIEADGQVIGGRRGATLTLGGDFEDTTNADNNSWQSTLPGLRGWSISSDTLWVQDAAPKAGMGAVVTITIPDGAGGTESFTVEHLQTIGLSFAADAIQMSSMTTGFDPKTDYGVRSLSISLDGLYQDPDSTSANDGHGFYQLLEARKASETIDVEVAFGDGASVSCEVTVGEITIEGPYDSEATTSIAMESAGVPTFTKGTSLDSGVDKLVDAMLNATKLDTSFKTDTTGGTTWTGDTVLTAFDISIPHIGPIEVGSVSLEGDGAITRS